MREPIKTSVTHPLRVDAVTVASGGRIGMTLCPGNHGPSVSGGRWERDLEVDLAAIAAWGAELAITLIEPHEYELLRIPDFERDVRASGVAWRFAPIRDVDVPDERFEEAWRTIGPEAHAILARGGSIVLHCRAGLGRTGMIAACLLVELGEDPDDAIRAVRRARRGTIQTREQEDYVRAFRAC